MCLGWISIGKIFFGKGISGGECSRGKFTLGEYIHWELYVLKVYPRVMKVLRKCNFIILSSATAERLFSVGVGIITPKRNMLGDGMFEKLLPLKGATKKLS